MWIGDKDHRPVDYEALVIYSDVLPCFNSRIHNEYSRNIPNVMSTVALNMHFLGPIPDENGPFVRARANITIGVRDLTEVGCFFSLHLGLARSNTRFFSMKR